MPGIAGIVGGDSNEQQRAALEAMIRCMRYESFYTSGTCAQASLKISAGWVNHTGSFSDGLPIWNERRDICLLFSGEAYPEQSELARLRQTGHEFGKGAGYIVHLYEELGNAFLNHLNGWFCGLLLDLRQQKALLFNDRYGVGRICYHESSDGFYFSSEAKALLQVLPQLRTVNFRSLGELLSCGCVLQNRTLFEGISLMPPGSAWTFSNGALVDRGVYFRKEDWEKQPLLSEADYYQKLKDIWARVLPRYFNGGKRIGLSLTGGVDSRMILAWATKSADEIPCYTFGGKYRDCADVKLSRELARLCPQPHQVITVNGEFLSRFPALAEKTVRVSDGAMDVTGAIDLFVQEKAREIAPVRVTGTNGGEILRSLVVFKPGRVCDGLLQPELENHVQQARSTYNEELQGRRLSFTAFKQAPWYMCSKFIVERSQLDLRMPYFDNDLVGLVYQAPPNAIADNDVSLRLIADGNSDLACLGTDRGVASRPIPAVTPVLHWFQEFMFKAEYAYDYGMPQWLARTDHLLAPLRLERLFLGRHKFHHFRVYYRDQLAGYLKEILLDARVRGRAYLNSARVETIVREHVAGRANYTLELHKLLSTELMMRQFVDAN